MLLTPELLRAALLNYAEELDGWGSFGAFVNCANPKSNVHDVPGIFAPVIVVDYQNVDVDKSYDGWTEDLWVVFDIGGTFYKATGTYTSYIGSEWSKELKVVVPKQKMVTYYEEA